MLIWIGFQSLVTDVNGQGVRFSPELVAGHRSLTYLHSINYQLNDHWKLNNLTLFDTGHTSDNNNIFFIRNTLTYVVGRHVAINAAIGMKNPGSFGTISLQFHTTRPVYTFLYSAGATYQKGITLEQTLLAEWLPPITDVLRGYFRVHAVGNLARCGYPRGFQHLRAGFRKGKASYGAGAGFDQFNNAGKRLANVGIFGRYNF